MKRTRVAQSNQQIIMSSRFTGQSLAATGFYNFAVGFLDSAAFISPAGLSVAIKIYRKRKKCSKIYRKLGYLKDSNAAAHSGC